MGGEDIIEHLFCFHKIEFALKLEIMIIHLATLRSERNVQRVRFGTQMRMIGGIETDLWG